MPETEHVCLYNRPEFISLNLVGDQHYERVDYHCADRLVGSLSGVVDGHSFISGFSAGFGGVDFVRDRERLEEVIETVAHCEAALKAADVRSIVVRAKPLHYSRAEALLELAFLHNGFSRGDDSLNFYLDLERYGTVQNYAKALRHAPSRQLRLALESGYDWREAANGSEWQVGYDVLSQSRLRHGATLSLSFEYVSKMRALFPDRVRLFVLYDSDDPVAATLLYAITSRNVQVMYWGDCEPRAAAEGRARRAGIMNLVAYRAVEEALKSGFRTLDLGPSASTKAMNFGNCAFKASINGQADFRRTYRKDL